MSIRLLESIDDIRQYDNISKLIIEDKYRKSFIILKVEKLTGIVYTINIHKSVYIITISD